MKNTYQFDYSGKIYYAELHICCGWLISDYNRKGIDEKSNSKIYDHFFNKVLKTHNED